VTNHKYIDFCGNLDRVADLRTVITKFYHCGIGVIVGILLIIQEDSHEFFERLDVMLTTNCLTLVLTLITIWVQDFGGIFTTAG